MSNETEMKQIADEVVQGLAERLPTALQSDRSGLYCVCAVGSYARGDFVGASSDLDLLLILDSTCSEDPSSNDSAPGVRAVQEMVGSLLAGRILRSHNPHQIDWLIVPWESIPKNQANIHVPDGNPELALLGIFLFDLRENLVVLWGEDPRSVMPEPLGFPALAKGWFDSVRIARRRMIRENRTWRIAFSAFKSIQVAQILFGEPTLDKRRLLELYERCVPDFPFKAFGRRIIVDKMRARYPINPCRFASWQEYANFEDALTEAALAQLNASTVGKAKLRAPKS